MAVWVYQPRKSLRRLSYLLRRAKHDPIRTLAGKTARSNTSFTRKRLNSGISFTCSSYGGRDCKIVWISSSICWNPSQANRTMQRARQEQANHLLVTTQASSHRNDLSLFKCGMFRAAGIADEASPDWQIFPQNAAARGLTCSPAFGKGAGKGRTFLLCLNGWGDIFRHESHEIWLEPRQKWMAETAQEYIIWTDYFPPESRGMYGWSRIIRINAIIRSNGYTLSVLMTIFISFLTL